MDDYVEIDYDRVLEERDNSFCLSICGEVVWIPKSQIAPGLGPDGAEGGVWIKEWLAKEKGLI